MNSFLTKKSRVKSFKNTVAFVAPLCLAMSFAAPGFAQSAQNTDQGGADTMIISTDRDTLLNSNRDDILKKAEDAADTAALGASKFVERPVFHFHPKAQWMNDPNGPIFYNGWFHLFYQYNPYSDGDGPKYWAHARSKDLVNWQSLPIALWPSGAGDDGVWSGSTFLNDKGSPVIFYTSWSPHRDPEQWAALPEDPNLIKWKKYSGNPVVSQKDNTDGKIAEWRDPFVFRYNNITYLITGGGINGRGRVFIYQANNPDLLSWKYLGILFTDPDGDVGNIECPNFAQVDGKWVLLISVHGRVESFTGEFNDQPHVFSTEKRGIMDDGSYASQIQRDKQGRLIHFAWIQPPHEPGWAGTMTLPVELHISDAWDLLSTPISQLSSLRDKKVVIKPATIDRLLDLSSLASGDQLEIEINLTPGDATHIDLKLRASSDFSRAMVISYDPANRQITVPGRSAMRVFGTGEDLKLHIFLDKSVIDLFADDGALALTGCASSDPADLGLGMSAQYPTGYKRPAEIKSMTVYTLKPAALEIPSP